MAQSAESPGGCGSRNCIGRRMVAGSPPCWRRRTELSSFSGWIRTLLPLRASRMAPPLAIFPFPPTAHGSPPSKYRRLHLAPCRCHFGLARTTTYLEEPRRPVNCGSSRRKPELNAAQSLPPTPTAPPFPIPHPPDHLTHPTLP